MRALLLIGLILLLVRTSDALAQTNCSEAQLRMEEARRLYGQGFYSESLRVLKQLSTEKKNSPCIFRDFYELESELLIAMNESEDLIDSVMRKMIREDPTYSEINPSRYSQAFYNRFKSFRIYPNFQIGVGGTLSGISISSKGELSTVFQSPQATRLNEVAPGLFMTTGLTAFSTYYFQPGFATKVAFTQNFPAANTSAYRLDADNRVMITENISSRNYSLSLIKKLNFIKPDHFQFLSDMGLELGYQVFNLYRSNSKYELLLENITQEIATRYASEVDTKPFRKAIVHQLLLGLSYEPQQFINNKRVRLIIALQFVLGLTDYNRIENRFDNQVSTQLYYYAEDRFRMKSVQFQLQLAYHAHYHKNKRR